MDRLDMRNRHRFGNMPVDRVAAIGQQAQELDQDFSHSPIVVAPGEYIGAVAKFIQGTATASQVIWAVVTFRGYYE